MTPYNVTRQHILDPWKVDKQNNVKMWMRAMWSLLLSNTIAVSMSTENETDETDGLGQLTAPARKQLTWTQC